MYSNTSIQTALNTVQKRLPYIFFIFQGGGYLLDLLDYYAAGWPYLFIGLCELIIIGHIYGIENFVDDLCSITDIGFNQWMRTHFYFIYQTLSPLIIAIILLISWSSHQPITKGDYVYPKWANGKSNSKLSHSIKQLCTMVQIFSKC